MPNKKYIVELDKPEALVKKNIGEVRRAKRLNRIFDDLAVHRECIIEGNDVGWHGVMRSFGKITKKKNLVENNLIEPIWFNLNSSTRATENRLIRLKPNIRIEKKEGNKKNFFKFIK